MDFQKKIIHSLTKCLSVINKNNSKQVFVVFGDGKIVAGEKKILPNHIHANADFQLDGKMAFKELVVVDPTKWADFVFEKNYSLMPLKELEKYCTTNMHLPGVPSEKEVKQNGINAAEMNAQLLQKIEENTIYIVELSKRLDALEAENTALKVKLNCK